MYDLSANEKMINYHKNWGVMWRALKGSWLYGIKLNPLQLGFNDITLRDTMTTTKKSSLIMEFQAIIGNFVLLIKELITYFPKCEVLTIWFPLDVLAHDSPMEILYFYK